MQPKLKKTRKIDLSYLETRKKQDELDLAWEKICMLEEELKREKALLAEKAFAYRKEEVYSRYFTVSESQRVNQTKAQEVLMSKGLDPLDYYYEIVQKRFNVKKVKDVLGKECPIDQKLSLRRKNHE